VAGRKKKEVDYLEVISDLAEVIELERPAGPILKKYKAVIDKAFSHMIMKDLGNEFDLVKVAKIMRSQKLKQNKKKRSK